MTARSAEPRIGSRGPGRRSRSSHWSTARSSRCPPVAARIEPITNLAGEPRDTVVFDGVVPDAIADAPEGVDADALRLRGALTRVALMSGALLAMADLSAVYTRERQQFGQPIGRFQAVQALLVKCAEEAALVDLAAQVIAREAERGEARFEIAAGKLLADDAARTATRAAHQAHGAIGMTQEYSLHQLSRRLWSWRAEYGDRTWPDRVGRAVVAARSRRPVPGDRGGVGVGDRPRRLEGGQPTLPVQCSASATTWRNGLSLSKLGSRGRPSARSPMPLRWISLVPPAIDMIRPFR